MKYKKTLIIILLSLFFIGFFPKNSLSISDIAYTFDDNVLTDSIITDFNSTFNVKESSYYTQDYNATYSFTNEPNETFGIDIEFVDTYNNPIDASVQIIENIGNHNKVLEIFDNTSITRPSIINLFDLTIIIGSIEFWFRCSDYTKGIEFRLQNGGNAVRIFLNNLITVNNVWYHYRIFFNTTSDLYTHWLNNVIINSDVAFDSISTGITQVNFITANSDFNYYIYIDAIGYSWQTTYNFESDIISNFPNDWIDFSTTGGNIEVISNLTQVVKFEMLEKDIGTANMYNNFNEREIDWIEFDISCNGTDLSEFEVTFEFDTTIGVYLTFGDDVFYYNDGSYHWNSSIIEFNNSIWYHNKIYFNTNSDTFTWYINDILYYENVDFLNNIPSINNIKVKRLNTGEWHEVLLDNVGYSWNNTYSIGTNLLPYLNPTSLNEVDKFQYALQEVNQLYPIGHDGGGWSESDSGGHDNVNVVANPNNANDRMIEIDTYNMGDTKGLFKNDFGINSNFVNITFGIDIELMAGTSSYNLMTIESSDFNTHSGIVIYHNGSLNVWSGTIAGSGYTLRNDITTGVYYEGNILLDYQLKRMIIVWYADSVYKNTYELPFVDIFGKEGLAEVRFTSHWSDNEARFNVDYCGVYADGISVSNEYGYTVYNIGQIWNTQINNLLYLQANGTFDIGVIEGSYTVGMSITTFRSLRNYYNEIHTINGYDSNTTTNNASFVFTLQNHYFNISIFKIDGVILKEGVNEYNLIFEHSGVDIDDSYFYVSSNILYFKHNADDTNLEYIQASFNINDVNSTDYSISYRSYIVNNAYGYMRINYTDTSNLIQLPPNSLTTTRFILSQERVVRNFVILITDKNNDVITGLTTGYIYNIELLNVLNIQVSIITESLLNMMVPLIIILIPTLAFSKRFGKQVITPFIVLFSLILTITSTIPAWLFFIILFPSLVIIFFKSKDDDI